MSPPTGRKRVRRSAHSFAATPFGIICQSDTCPCPLVGRLAVVPTAPALRYHVEHYFCADVRQDFAAIRRELVADTDQEIARACSNPTALRATLTPSSRGWFCSVLRSTAPAPLGVRKVHKIVYNISSIFNLGSALRALAAVPLLYYTRVGLGLC